MEKARSQMADKPLLPRVISISSGKGGVGKSSICVNLGISLAKTGARVCLLDADTGLANANILLGLSPEFNLEHVLFGAKAIEDVMLDGPYGLKIIPGANGISECVGLHPRQQMRLTRELSRIESEYDYLLIDTAAGVAPTTLDFICASHCALIVITPEPTSLTDAFSMIKLLKRRSGTLQYQIVVNMSGSAGQAKEVFHRFTAAVEKYIGVHCDYLGFILRDESMRAAVVLQNPVTMFPDSDPSCRSFKVLADKLDIATADFPVEPPFSEYWQRQYSTKATGLESRHLVPVASKPQVPKVEPTVVQDEVKDLRLKISELIEQKKVSVSSIQSLLQESVDKFIDVNDQIPVDMVKLVDYMVASPESYDQLVSDIAERVKPWVDLDSVNVDPALSLRDMVDETDMNPESSSPTIVPEVHFDIVKDSGEIVSTDKNEMAEECQDSSQTLTSFDTADPQTIINKPLIARRVGGYDNQKFGSQEDLLALLRSDAGANKPLLELLCNL